MSATTFAERRANRDLSRIGWLDYLLMTLGSCFAGYSGGMAINEPGISWFVVQWTLVGALVSYLVRKAFIRSPFLKVDGVLYGGVVVISFIMRSDLQKLMPAGGFPFEVLAAGWLCWMLILGSFCTWQDSTLLFQAVPSIAIFGLVGCYDTFRGAVFLFFGFLMCLATLFARAHYREMLKQAAESGYFTRGLAPGTPIPEVETTPGLALKMQEGPWRWVAGPEWALGSALVVVLVSLLGAPVIRQSTQGVSGFVRIPPAPVRNQATTNPSIAQSVNGEARIGNGPVRLTERPVLEAVMPRALYLRTNTYDNYSNRVWRFMQPGPEASSNQSASPTSAAYDEMTRDNGQPEQFPFLIRLRQPLSFLPYPGEAIKWLPDKAPPNEEVRDGSYSLGTPSGNPEYEGMAAFPRQDKMPTDAQTELPPPFMNMLDLNGVDPKVVELAKQVAGSGDDYTRANRIMEEVARRIRYNTNVAPSPGDRDPVEHALFERHEAYCDIFASAMTQMARAAGIPARYVVGYLPSEERKFQGDRYLVVEADGHAWSELYFKGIGWVVFDATGLADAVPGAERGATTDDRAWYQKPWVKSLLDGTMIVLGMVAVFFAYRAFDALRKARTPRSEMEKVYLRFSRLLERTGRQRRGIGTTADEFLRQVGPQLGSVEPKAAELNRRFEAKLYGPSGITEQDVKELSEQVRQLGRELSGSKKGA